MVSRTTFLSLVFLLVVTAIVVVGYQSSGVPPDTADRDVPGATTGSGRNSLVAPPQ